VKEGENIFFRGPSGSASRGIVRSCLSIKLLKIQKCRYDSVLNTKK
jgi:hypothetical protein